MDNHFDKDLKYHELIAREYDDVVVAPRIVTNDVLYRKFAGLMHGKRMLDLGCGTGHMSLRFGHAFKEVVAVDHSQAMLSVARAKAAERKLTQVQFICDSVFNYVDTAPLDSFDAVCCTGFLHHLKADDIAPLVRKIAGVMREKAVLITSEPIRIDPGSVPSGIRKWNATSIAARLDYSQHAEQPDEAPIEQEVLLRAMSTAGLSVVKTSRNWEIFPHNMPPSLWDKVIIRTLNMRHGELGNVFTIAAEKRPA